MLHCRYIYRIAFYQLTTAYSLQRLAFLFPCKCIIERIILSKTSVYELHLNHLRHPETRYRLRLPVHPPSHTQPLRSRVLVRIYTLTTTSAWIRKVYNIPCIMKNQNLSLPVLTDHVPLLRIASAITSLFNDGRLISKCQLDMTTFMEARRARRQLHSTVMLL